MIRFSQEQVNHGSQNLEACARIGNEESWSVQLLSDHGPLGNSQLERDAHPVLLIALPQDGRHKEG